MKAALCALWLCLLSIAASAVDYTVFYQNTGAPMGPNSYTTKETYELWVTLVPMGALPASSTITVKNLADGTSQTRAVNANGVISAPIFNYTVPALDASGIGSTKSYDLSISTSWSNQLLAVDQMQCHIKFTRENSPTKPGANVTRKVYQTLLVPGKDMESGQWNLVINTRSRINAGTDYTVKWQNAPARLWSVEAENPPTNKVGYFNHSEDNIAPYAELGPPRTVQVWRRVRPGTWVLIANASCPFGATLYLNDYPADPLAEVPPPDPEDPESGTPPPDAEVQNSNGTGTGTTTGTGGTGLGGASGPGTGPGSGSGSGSGGSGTDDPSGDTGANVDVPEVPSTASLDAIKTTVETYQETVVSASSDVRTSLVALDAAQGALLGALGQPAMPTVSGGWDLRFPLHIGGTVFNLSLAGYSELFQWVRNFLLAIVTVTFWVMQIQLMQKVMPR